MGKEFTNVNKLAKLLHPHRQEMVVTEVIEENATMKTYVLKSASGQELAYFNAGDYIPVFVEIDGNQIERPYALASSPKESTDGIYAISVKKANGGYVSSWIHENWKVGSAVTVGGPGAGLNYNPIRDSKHIIALAGGIGITPMRSMAKALIDGDIDCDITLFYGANTLEEVAYAQEWKTLEAAAGGKLKVVTVIANEEVEGCEKGFITLDMVKKYCEIDNSSWFICGPAGMEKAVKGFLEPLNIPRRYVRFGMGGDSGYHTADANTCKITVHFKGETRIIDALCSETVLMALEKAGYQPAVKCRSGKCGFCRSLVVNGTYESVVEEDGVRRADRKYGYIHPCSTRPTGDLEIIVQSR